MRILCQMAKINVENKFGYMNALEPQNRNAFGRLYRECGRS